MRTTYGPIAEVRPAPWAVAILLVLAALVPLMIMGLIVAAGALSDLGSRPSPMDKDTGPPPRPDPPR